MGCAYGSRRIKKDIMKRIDLYITEEQDSKLKDLSTQGLSKSFLVRKGLELLFNSEYFIKLIKESKEDT